MTVEQPNAIRAKFVRTNVVRTKVISTSVIIKKKVETAGLEMSNGNRFKELTQNLRNTYFVCHLNVLKEKHNYAKLKYIIWK
jgi:hypothetical protein